MLNAFPIFDQRPLVIAVAGPNGAGKTTFYYSQLISTGLPFVNADLIVRDSGVGVYEAASMAEALREELIEQKSSFVFETVFSDPIGDKVAFLKRASEDGYTVVLCYIGIAGANISEQRVAGRVMKGGHDVPNDKLKSRYPRTLENLGRAVRELPHVLIFDNDSTIRPYRLVAVTEAGDVMTLNRPMPAWLKGILP